MPMKKVLIITYYWPPAGGPGVQRILKFAKYLPQFDWQPLILTVTDGEYPALDPSLKAEIPEEARIFKTRSLEPNHFYKKFVGLKKDSSVPTAVLAEENSSAKKSLAHWIRLNLFIPDAKIGWLPYAHAKGKKIIDEYKPDVIFSSSPPPTVHLIARRLKFYRNLKWVADFRDPWTDIHYYENKNRLGITKNIDQNLENKVLADADKIICISQLDIEHDFSNKINVDKCINIPNGFDEEDFKATTAKSDSGKKFTLLHLGAVGIERNPVQLFNTVHSLHEKKTINPESFLLRFIGSVEQEIVNTVDRLGINNYVEFIEYMPHAQAVEQSTQASAMLLLVTQSKKNFRILPGKTFEYLRTGKPILALGPQHGEVDRILSEVQGGKLIDYADKEKIESYLVSLIVAWKNDRLSHASLESIQKYERKNLTADLVEVFENVIENS